LRLRHFHELQPICPVCRSAESEAAFPLEISHAIREKRENVIEGLLRCTNTACQYEYPIIDGIPLILPNLREYLSANAEALRTRDDLSDTLQSVFGDCCGPGTTIETARQQVASYAWGHYGDLDPQNNEPDAGSTVDVFQSFTADVSSLPDGPVLDIGCAVGRIAFELAEQTGRLTLGIDVNASMLRVAAHALHQSEARYPHRHTGVVYEERKFPLEFTQAGQVDFWGCDALALPFNPQSFAHVSCLNTLDSVHSPLGLLQSISRAAKPSATVHLGCPYDWSSAVTPIEGWIGGHSQRAPHGGRPEVLLNAILQDGVDGVSGQFDTEQECNDVPWIVRLHDRSRMHYSLHALGLRRR